MIEPLTFDACWWIAVDLRPEDRRELAVTRNPDNVESLVQSALDSEFKWSATKYWDTPAFAFGAKITHAGKGAHVWGFGATNAGPVLRPVTRFIRRVMIPQLLDSGVEFARAVSHPANETSHRWLEHLGFTLKARLTGIGARREDMLLYETSARAHRRILAPLPLFAAA